jgi:hypothetical protein
MSVAAVLLAFAVVGAVGWYVGSASAAADPVSAMREEAVAGAPYPDSPRRPIGAAGHGARRWQRLVLE